MPKLRVHNFSVSLDGYGAGPDQNLDTPLGVGGEELHNWCCDDPHLPQDARRGGRRRGRG